MKRPEVKFIAAVIIMTAGCAVLQDVWNSKSGESLQLSYGWLLLAFFALTVTGFHLFLLRSAKGDPKVFIRSFMMVMALKLMVYALALVALLLLTTGNQKVLAAHFLAYYALFTVLEVTALYRELQKAK